MSPNPEPDPTPEPYPGAPATPQTDDALTDDDLEIVFGGYRA